MTDWLSGALDDLCEVEYGTRVTRKRDGGTRYPVYGGGGATFNLDDFNREDQMIISRFAMSEECVRFVAGKFFLNDSGLTVRTRDESKMSQEFLDQQLLARSNEIYATARGTAQKNMDMTMFRSMKLAIPDSLAEQERIVALLDAATARVTELTECYEQARTHASNLFESACRTEFDDQHLKSPIATLPDVSKNLDGRRKPITKSDRESGDVPYYGASGIVDYVKGHIFDEPTLLISEDGANLLARSSPIAFKADGRYWVNNHAHVVKFDSTVTETYVEIFLNSIPIDNWVTGAAQPKLTQAALNRIPIPMPPMDEQMRIVARLESMRNKTSEMVNAYDAKLSAAKNLRQSILEAAFAGVL
jgi:type I restriction enzyme S subunit